MELAELIEGNIRILRDNVDGWSTVDGQSHVYPQHPPTSLDSEDYPRATVDVIASETSDSDIEQKRFIEDVLVDVTVYAIDPLDVNQLLGDSKQAIVENHDSTYTDSNGNVVEYLPNWSFVAPGTVSPQLEEGGEEGLTRYNRTFEVDFRTINTK